jgi:hypothetical protein
MKTFNSITIGKTRIFHFILTAIIYLVTQDIFAQCTLDPKEVTVESSLSSNKNNKATYGAYNLVQILNAQ